MMNEDTEVEINDGKTVHKFTATLIGHSSTEERDSLRWSECDIYRTTGGQYVMMKTGVTNVVHDPAAPCANPELDVLPVAPDDMPCPICKPAMHGLSTVRVEVDRYIVLVSKDEETCRRQALNHQRGEVFMTTVAQNALDQAFGRDSASNYVQIS